MKKDEYRAALLIVYTQAMVLAAYDLDEMIAAIDRAETLGPIVDPTLWKDKRQSMAEDRAVLEAALPLWRMGRELNEEGEHFE